MPAPSPVLPSASTAPRCHTAFSASIADWTTLRDATPSVAATRPTPHASPSNSGRYMPSRARRSRSAESIGRVIVSVLHARGGEALLGGFLAGHHPVEQLAWGVLHHLGSDFGEAR